MYKSFYEGSTLLHLPIFVLIFFLAVFVGTILWLFVFQRRSGRFSRLAYLPLDSDEGPIKQQEKESDP